jgi:hypothetical protein
MEQVLGIHVIDDLRQLPPAREQAVIINCGTKWVSTLALASTLRHAGMPVLIIDCESADGSAGHFAALARRPGFDFHWLSWPLRPHGHALDRLFSEIPAETVLLVDSDVEIRTSPLIAEMLHQLDAQPLAYGAGFRQPSAWLGPPQHLLPPRTGYFAERMWIPLVLLRVVPVREAIAAGNSFMARRPFQEIAGYPRLSRWLGYRFRLPGLRHIRWLPGPARERTGVICIDGVRPAFIDFDTGAELHALLTARGRPFAALPQDRWGEVHHYHGVTRARLGGALRALAARIGMVSRETHVAPHAAVDDAMLRLRDQYGIDANDID